MLLMSYSYAILCCVIFLLQPLLNEVSTGKHWAHTIIILSVFWCTYMLVDHSSVRLCALHDARGTDSHTKPQHIIQNWISASVFKYSYQQKRAGLEWRRFCAMIRGSGALSCWSTQLDTSTPTWPCFRWLSYLMSRSTNRTQHLWENET